jgi:hypothetical protein
MILSLRMATLQELRTVYSLEDVYDMIEVANVDSYNRRLLEEARRQADES